MGRWQHSGPVHTSLESVEFDGGFACLVGFTFRGGTIVNSQVKAPFNSMDASWRLSTSLGSPASDI